MAASEKHSLESAHSPSIMEAATPASKENEHHLSGFKMFTTMSSLTFIGFLMMLDVSVVTTAIPKITSEFHNLNDVGWYGTAYVLSSCAAQPLTGKIYAEFNMKWGLLAFFAIFEIGSAICGAATSSTMFIIGRAVAGLGSSGLLNGGYGVLYAIMPLAKQPLLVGILIGVSQLGVLSGPLIGGALTQYASWRWCFYINLPSGGLAGLIFLLVSIPTGKDSGGRTFIQRILTLDLIGFFFFAPAAIQLILALEWGGTRYPWKDATIIGLFCGSFGTFVVFGLWEQYMGDKAMIPLAIIKRRVIWSSCINYGFFVGAMLSATYYLPLYFQAVRNATPTMSGVDMLPSIISTLLFGIISGGLIGRVGFYLPFAVLSACFVMIGSGLTSKFNPTTSIGVWIGYQIIMGAGRGMGFQTPIIAVQNNSRKEDVSIVNALVVFAQQLGGAIFLSLDQVVFSSGLRKHLATYAPEISPKIVVAAGALGIREAIPAASLPGVILAYSKSIDEVMYVATGAAGGAFLFAFGMGWLDIRKKAGLEKIENSSTDTETV